MTKNTNRIKPTDLNASAPQADGFSWSESQTGTAVHQERTEGDEAERTVTMLDYTGSPVVTATEAPKRGSRAPRPEI
jgi:hypothetical protein